jgi:hypothetical protein
MSDLADTPTMPTNLANSPSQTTTALSPEMAQIMIDNFSKKGSLANCGALSTRQNLMNSSNSALSSSERVSVVSNIPCVIQFGLHREHERE